MAIPLHTFEPTGDPFVDDLNFLLENPTEMPLLSDWFRENSHLLQYTSEQIIEEAMPYAFRRAPWGTPGPSGNGIYFLVNEGKIAYVGRAMGISSRLASHFHSRKQFTHYWAFGGIPYDWHSHVEGFYINRFEPYLNSATVPYSRDLDKIHAELFSDLKK